MESHVTTSGGTSLYVEDVGTGPTILAIHGLGGGAYFFRGLAHRLHHRYRILSVDLPGTGRSVAGHEGMSLESWVDDIGDLVADRVGLPIVIVGHSLGTIIALESWEAWPDWIRGLVFVGGLPEPRLPIRERLTQRIAHVREHGMTGLGSAVAPGIFAQASLDAKSETVALWERVFEAQPPESYIRSAEILIAASAQRIVPTVHVPCLAITGQDDQYAPPDAVAAFVKRLPDRAREEVLAACGHMPFLEAPDAFADLIASFMTGL